MPPLRRLTALTAVVRPLDVSHASNRFAVAVSIATVAVAWPLLVFVADSGVLAGLGRAVSLGVGAFLAWAIGRELDPDRPNSARVAGALFAGLAWLGTPQVAAVLVLLLAVRIVARTTGRPPTTPDLVALTAIGAYAATSGPGFAMALAAAAALHLDTRLPGPADARSEVAAVATTVAAIVVTILGGGLLDGWQGPGPVEAVLIVAAVAAVFRMGLSGVRATGDLTGEPLMATRVVSARRLLVGALAGGLAWAGAGAVVALLPALAALLGTAVVDLVAARSRASRSPDLDPAGSR